jgi:hypothetical protein
VRRVGSRRRHVAGDISFAANRVVDIEEPGQDMYVRLPFSRLAASKAFHLKKGFWFCRLGVEYGIVGWFRMRSFMRRARNSIASQSSGGVETH